MGRVVAADLRGRPARVPALRRPDADRGVHHAGGGDRPDPHAPAHARHCGGSAWSAQPALDRRDRRDRRSWRTSTTARNPRVPPRALRVLQFLNAGPRPPAHGSGPFGARGDPTSVRRHGATTCRGAEGTTRDAGRRATDPTWTARGVVAQWATPRDVPTTPIQNPIPKRRPQPFSR